MSDTKKPERPEQERIEAQPLYIQDYIRNLETALDNSMLETRELAEQQTPTRVQYGDVWNNPKYLPDDKFARVQIGVTADEDKVTEDMREPDWIQVSRNVNEVTGKITLQVIGSSSLYVLPSSNNSCSIAVERS